MEFPKGFYWGAATAAYQIEGAKAEDGKGESVWDVFTRKDGAIARGENGDVACDHYHRYAEDVRLMKEMGLNAYRFSVSWPRLLPDGTGKINEKGLSFYDKLIDALLGNGIEPFLTLYHWDLPQALQQRGGFLNPDMPAWFGEYAQAVKKMCGGRVRHFMTLNEPQCVLGCGYRMGTHAPGLKVSLKEQLSALHNLLKAHGTGAQVLKDIKGAEVATRRAGTRMRPRATKKRTSRRPTSARSCLSPTIRSGSSPPFPNRSLRELIPTGSMNTGKNFCRRSRMRT